MATILRRREGVLAQVVDNVALVPAFDCRPMQRHPRVVHRPGVIAAGNNGIRSFAREEMPDRQGAAQCGRFQFVKNTACTQSPAPNPHPVSLLRSGPVKSQQVYGDGLDRLWRVVAMMLDAIWIAPHGFKKRGILVRPERRPFRTREKAERHERAIQYFKRHRDGRGCTQLHARNVSCDGSQLVGAIGMSALARQLQRAPGVMTIGAAVLAVARRRAVTCRMRAFLLVSHFGFSSATGVAV